MRRWALAAVLLLCGSPAWAWVEPDRSNVVLAYDVPGGLLEAARGMAAEKGNAEPLRHTFTALQESVEALTRLQGVSPYNEGDVPATARWYALPRAAQLQGADGAWFHAGRSVGAINEALKLKEPFNPNALTHLRNARAALRAIDRGLLYVTSPNGPILGRPGIGHGDRNAAVNRIHTSIANYDLRFLQGEWLTAYRDMGPDPGLRMQLAQVIVAIGSKLRAAGLWMRVFEAREPPGRTWTPAQREACSYEEAFRLLWIDAAQAYFFAMHSDPLADAWRTGVDASGWSAFFLPVCRGVA